LSVSAPPNTFAPPLSVGRFCLCKRQTTREERHFCVCHHFLHVPQIQPRLPPFCSLLSKNRHKLLRFGTRRLLNNIAQTLAYQASRDLSKSDKQRWAVNSAYALKQAGPAVVCAFKAVAKMLKRSVKALTAVLSKTLERIRPNRSFPREYAIGGARRPRKAYR
jgi:hypothetical protein